jgi:hypothetical protein
MSTTVTVHNIATHDKFEFVGLSTAEAVRAAHAQARGDFNTVDYEWKYPLASVRVKQPSSPEF